MLVLDVLPFLIFSLVCVFAIVQAFPQSFWIIRLDTFTDFLACRAKLPKPAVQELKSTFSLPSPFFPTAVARSLLHSPAQSAPASPAASALKVQQVTSSLSLWKVFVPWSPPKAASGTSFTLCPSSPHPQAPAWTLLLCDLSQMKRTQLPQVTPALLKICSLQVLVSFGAFASSGCRGARAESLFSPVLWLYFA